VWNGSAWVNAKSAKVWNGSAWVNFLSSVNITNQSIIATGSDLEGAYASATYRLNSNGQASAIEDASFLYNEYDFTGEWLVGGSASDFSVRATIQSQNLGSSGYTLGTFGSWLALTTTREWSIITNASGPADSDIADMTVLIELAYTDDTSKVIDSAEIFMQAFAQNA
jgi:hypothetical protein